MPPFRNPFNKKPPVVNGVSTITDENSRPSLGAHSDQASGRPSYAGSRASSSLSIKPRKEETAEYKLSGVCPMTRMEFQDRADPRHSVVNDSGVYLPVSILQDLPRYHTSTMALINAIAFTARKKGLLAEITHIYHVLQSSKHAQ